MSFALRYCRLTQQFMTVMLFLVSVPVLSEQMRVALPSVSTMSVFLTSTCSHRRGKRSLLTHPTNEDLGQVAQAVPCVSTSHGLHTFPMPRVNVNVHMPACATRRNQAKRALVLMGGLRCTWTFFMRSAVSVSADVTVAGRPWAMLAISTTTMPCNHNVIV